MTDYQDVQLKMFLEVSNFFDIYKDIFGDNKILKKHYNNLDELIADLRKYIAKQEIDTTGYAVAKRKVKAELTKQVYGLSASIRTFAVDTNNDPLFNEFDTSLTSIKRFKDVDILNYAGTILAKLTEYEEQLKPYGLTPEELVNLGSRVEDYKKLLLQPAEQRKEKAVATAKIKKLISAILRLLKYSLDNDMMQYQDTQEDLYQKYLNLREIDDNKTTALSIKGKVTDAHNPDLPLQYVQVTVKFKPGSELSGNVKSAYTTTTTKLGNFQFKGLPEGACRVKFEKNNYRTLELNSEVHTGKFTKLDVFFAKEEV